MRIRISIHGALYIALGSFLLISGFLRGELLSTVCGGALTLYTVFTAASLGITACCWRNEEPQCEIWDGRFTVSPEPGLKRGGYFPFCAAGTAVYYIFEYALTPASDAETVLIVSVPLHTRATAHYTADATRGRYFYKRQYIRITDFAGFFSLVFRQPIRLHQPYTVPAPVLPFEYNQLPLLAFRAVQDAPSMERTSELYESRPYFPGDDPRKIHWKLYAHTQTLSIKLGAFEPPPVKQLTIYIEEYCIMKKKNRAMLASVFDAFIGRIAFLISRLLEADIQCTLLLPESAQQAAPRTPVRRYNIPPGDSAAMMHVRTLLAIPAVRSAPDTIPDAASVFTAVSKDSGLLYCALPAADPLRSRSTSAADTKPTAMEAHSAEAKIAACRRAGVQTYFYIGLPPSPSGSTATPEHSGVRRERTAAASLRREYLNRLLYVSTASARKERVYRRLAQAARQELAVFTAGNCHAELL